VFDPLMNAIPYADSKHQRHSAPTEASPASPTAAISDFLLPPPKALQPSSSSRPITSAAVDAVQVRKVDKAGADSQRLLIPPPEALRSDPMICANLKMTGLTTYRLVGMCSLRRMECPKPQRSLTLS
jgi:hypothetical protein